MELSRTTETAASVTAALESAADSAAAQESVDSSAAYPVGCAAE
jgi:hypothetical protein